MMLDDIKNRLESVLTPKRFIHSLNVMNCAAELASKYKEDSHRAAVAGLLHDCARDMKKQELLKLCEHYGVDVDNISCLQPVLLHGPLGSRFASEEYGISDESILSAISCHTTGRENMDMLAKIVFIADCIEPNRCFDGVLEIRKAAFEDIDSAMITALDRTIEYIIARGSLIHPDTISARNYIIMHKAEVSLYK